MEVWMTGQIFSDLTLTRFSITSFLTVAQLSLGSRTDRNDTVIYRKIKTNVKE